MEFEIENKLDVKITEFTEAIHNEITKQIGKCVKQINNSIQKIREDVGRFKLAVENRINEFTNSRLDNITNIQSILSILKVFLTHMLPKENLETMK